MTYNSQSLLNDIPSVSHSASCATVVVFPVLISILTMTSNTVEDPDIVDTPKSSPVQGFKAKSSISELGPGIGT